VKTKINQQKRGFTLVEIMIVVAILGILAAISFVNIQTYRTKALKVACVKNLKEIENFSSLWAINNGKNGDDTISMNDLVPAYIKTTPYCPLDAAKAGYVLTTVSEKPQCPIDPAGHSSD
jgi:prepilin-type N-terminal cleavage/methylation domain-containing protein